MKNNIPKFLAGDTVYAKGVRGRLKVVQVLPKKRYMCGDGNAYNEKDLHSPFEAGRKV